MMKYAFSFASILALAAITAGAQPATDIRKGLVAYWPMESTDGTTTPDSSTFANNLNVVNMNAGNFTPGKFGNAALLVPASTTYMTNLHATDNVTGLPIYNAKSYTIAMWVKGAAQTAKYLFSEGNLTDTDPLLILQTGQLAGNNAKLDVIIRNDANNATPVNHVVSTAVVFDNAWHHIAWVDDRGYARLYVDGVLDSANFNYTAVGSYTFNTTAIGTLVRTTVSTGAIFNGQIDDLAVWERPLTVEEVRQVMTNSLQTPVPVSPPHVLAQPTNTLHLGDRLTLRAVGLRPATYQWAKDGLDISGATSSTYVLSNLTQADAGNYTVRVTGPDLTSSPAAITVLPDGPVNLRTGLVSFWPFEEINENAEQTQTFTPDLYSRNDITLFPYPFLNQPGGQFGNAVGFDGSTQYGVKSSGFPIYNNPAFSVSFWVNGALQSDRRIFAEDATNNQFTLFSFGSQATGLDGTLRVFIRTDNNVVIRDRQSTRTALDSTWHHVVWTDDNGWAKLYIDGSLDETEFTYARGLLTANRTAIGALARTPLAAQFAGSIDELAVWNRVLSFTEIQEIRANSVPPPIAAIPPTISQQPTNRSVFTEGAATFSVVAVGTGPLSAQWRKNSNNISGATNFSLSFNSASLADAGHYDVIITNIAGSVTSHVATLTVTLRPPPPAELKIDFNNIGQESAADTQPGFSSFALDAFGPGPFRHTYGGAEVTLTGVGVNLQSRARATPVNSATLTEGQIFRDFIFAGDSAMDQGMDILISFMPPDTLYDVTIWSFDQGSTGNRISDWSANGSLVEAEYTFNGSVLPTADGQNRFTFPAQTDSAGNILIQGRRNSSATAANNVFINGLQLTERQLRIVSIENIAFDATLRLTVKLRNAAASHRLLQKTSLTDAEWTEVIDAVYLVPDNGTQQIIAPVPATSTRFYMIEEMQ